MRLIDADALRKDLFVAITTQKSWMDSAKKSDSGTLFQLAQQAYFTLLECKQHLEKAPTIYDAPAAQPELKYTKEEMDVFRHGISLSLLSKRSSQHWRYDEDTAKEIEFLEKLYKKVVADMRGEQDG